jgi:choline-sulfatase
MNRPNILFLHIDQQNPHAIAANGCPYVSTPNMDHLVAKGVSFEHSCIANPVCMPSRSTWYTGLMSEEHGQLDNNKPDMDPSIADIGPLVRSGGYDPVFMGKWHVARPVEKSFDALFRGHGCGEVGDAATARAAEAFIANREGSKPFFLNVGLLNPHDCCMWGYDFNAHGGPAKYSLGPGMIDQLPPLPPNHRLSALPTAPEFPMDPTLGHWTDVDWRYYMYCYYRQVEMVDAEVGRIVAALENSRFADNTVLIFASDHGDGLAQHYHYGKGSPLDPSLMAPLVFIDPNARAYRNKTHIVSSIDVTATICDYAGVDPLPGRRGWSLRPLVEGKKTDWRSYAAASAFSGRNRLIRTTQHKLINDRKTNEYVMYDLVKDPWEMKSVVADAAYASTLKQLKDYMDANEATYHYAPATIQRFEALRKQNRV